MPDRYPMFANRRDAGRQLAARLRKFARSQPIVLALVRGGVPVAYEIASSLSAPLDLLLVRKLSAPGNEEIGIGAVVDGAEPELILNDDIVGDLQLGPDYIRDEMSHQIDEIERRRTLYLGDTKPVAVTGRTVIVVDDGVATGGTAKAALRSLRRKKPARLIFAVPVAPRSAIDALQGDCDEFIYLAAPELFGAVSMYYRDFTQTDDDTVRRLMEQGLSR